MHKMQSCVAGHILYGRCVTDRHGNCRVIIFFVALDHLWVVTFLNIAR